MSILDDFEMLMHGVQATRRYVERLACPIGGGSGVRAHFYPHQIQNVQRILSATHIRHLIADEVGMGKTVQALMVAHAVRLQRGKLRVRVIVGRTELQEQWRKEIQTRSHPFTTSVLGEDWFNIHSEKEISKPSEFLSADQFDLLIVDEPQSLRADLLGYIAERSADYARLLLLTASPNLRDVRRLCELLQMIEPARIERVRRELDADKPHNDADWSQTRLRGSDIPTLHRIYQQYQQGCRAFDPDESETTAAPAGVSDAYQHFADFRKRRLLADSRWQYRNILRAQRACFGDHLPLRKHTTLSVEPTVAERIRMSVAANCAGRIYTQDREADFLRRIVLGGESLLDRARVRTQAEEVLRTAFEHIRSLAVKETADARLDELVDWLAQFWQTDPQRKVIIAAQDNITVKELEKELAWRLPQVGLRESRMPLGIVAAIDNRDRFSNADEAHSETMSPELIAYLLSQLSPFEEPSNQLLIAHDIFRQSYNLQMADALIFYSMPWTPEDVDQWIGRVDRLGRNFIDPEKKHSPPKPIRIVTIHRRGDPSAQVESTLREHRIFESALDFDRELHQRITEDVYREVLPTRHAGDQTAEQIEEELARTADTQELTPPRGSWWTTDKAVNLFNEFVYRNATEPLLRQTGRLGYVSGKIEEGLSTWLTLLEQHRIVASKPVSKKHSGRNRRLKVFTLSQEDCKRQPLASLAEKGATYPPFFLTRRHIQQPPRWQVVTGMKADEPRRAELQFLSHGSRLHDEIVSTMMKAGRKPETLALKIYSLGERFYPNGTELKAGTYLCGVGFVDPATCYSGSRKDLDVIGTLDSDAGEQTILQNLLKREQAKFFAGVESDERFVRIIAPTSLCVLAWALSGEKKAVSTRDAADLLSADWNNLDDKKTEDSRGRFRNTGRPEAEAVSRSKATPQLLSQVPTYCSQAVAQETKTRWLQNIENIRQRIEERCELICIEAEDVLWNLQAAIADFARRTELLDPTGGSNLVQRQLFSPDDSTAQLQELDTERRRAQFEFRVRLLQRQAKIVRRARDARCRLLAESLKHIENPSVGTVHWQATAFIQLKNDPHPPPAPESVETSEVLGSVQQKTHDGVGAENV